MSDVGINFVHSHPLKIGSRSDKVLVFSEPTLHFVVIFETFEGCFDFIGLRIERDRKVNHFHVGIQAAKTPVRESRGLDPHEYLISILLT